MKQLFTEKGAVKPFPVPKPHLNTNSILVKVAYSFISTGTEGSTITESKKSLLQKCLTNTTDKITKVMGAVKENGMLGTMALIKGSLNKVLELGYSCSGEVVAVGKNVEAYNVGDFVACAGAGIANHAEYVAVPKHLAVKLASNKHLKQASITTIGAIALQGIRRANLQLGERVCIIGLGLIGQLTVQLAKLSGCKTFGVDIDDSKLFLAQKIGCDHVYNAQSSDITKDIDFHTNHYGVDTTIITAAAQSGTIIQQAMETTRRKGKVVLVGDVKINFDRNPFYAKEIDFLISCSYGPGRYDNTYEQQGIDYPHAYVRWTENRNMQLFADLIQQEKIAVDPLVSQEVPFEKAGKAYESLTEKKNLGIILTYHQDKTSPNNTTHQEPTNTDIVIDPSNETIAYAKPYVQPEKTTNVAFIGAGGFAKVKLLPLASKIKNVDIHTIIDTNPTNAINVAKLYKAKKSHNNYHEILNDQEINAVVIATPHAFHTQQTIECLKAGKAVFVEKPAAVTYEQLATLEAFLSSNKDSLFCVDFNRSFAPFILSMKKAFQNRTTPLMIHYRMNAGFIPKDHWIQATAHGGRIIGEACHIFELFSFLTDAKPKTFTLTPINTVRDDLKKSDNFSVQITYDDGSICTLLYTAMGNTNMNKERMEVFFDGKSIVMDDYKELHGYGLPRSFNQKSKRPDKGHKTLFTQFFEAARYNKPSPIPMNRIITATKLSIQLTHCIQQSDMKKCAV